MEEQRQYRNDLLDWCHNLYANWNHMKPRFSQIFDLGSLEEWEVSCLQLHEKLQTDQNAGIDEYQTAISLYEQWERMSSVLDAYEDVENRSEMVDHGQAEPVESEAFHVEAEVEADHDMDINEPHSHEVFLEMVDSPEEIESGMNVGSHSPHEKSFDMELESDHHMESEEHQRYQDELLSWCMNMYSNWENMKPRFSKLFDMESLKEWEGSCLQLKEKLEADGNADMDDYQTAMILFEHYQNLIKETYAYQEA